MKKKFFLTALLMAILTAGAFAGKEGEIDDRVLSSFKKEFADASGVQWERNKEMVKASFQLNGQYLVAFFATEGKLLAVSRNLAASELPISLYKGVQRFYNNYWISDLFEIAMNNETVYYITLQNGDQTLVLSSHGTKGWEFYSKKKKDIE